MTARMNQNWLQKFTLILRALWLLFPTYVFVILTWQCLWTLSQGKDIIIAAFEKERIASIFLLALVFFTLVVWYTGRILVYRKREISEEMHSVIAEMNNKNKSDKKTPDELPLYLQIIYNLPRVFAFLIFSFVLIAFLKLPQDSVFSFKPINTLWSYLLLLASIAEYVLLYQMAKKIRKKFVEPYIENEKTTGQQRDARKRINTWLYAIFLGVLLLLLFLNALIKSNWLIFISVFILQLLFPFLVVLRRDRQSFSELPLSEPDISYSKWLQQNKLRSTLLYRLMYHANLPVIERKFFIWFNVISLVGFLFYCAAILSFSFSKLIGPFPFVFLAFGVLSGFLGFFATASVITNINIHFFVFLLIGLVGMFTEPHQVNLVDTQINTERKFDARPSLANHFKTWIEKRRSDIEKDSAYPIYFVLADGGASRSGYWAASVLSRLHDQSNGKFSRHLFCLSGASGGSVGNGAFFCMLLPSNKSSPSFQNVTTEYLRTDFLTFTLARMLGPDIARFIFPLPWVRDRATALEYAVQKGGSFNNVLRENFSGTLSQYIPSRDSLIDVPILCINTTRMQDGQPGIITNIKPDSLIFGHRVDVLGILPPGKDMKLSTAVVMGARFPYVSPAGRIVEHRPGQKNKKKTRVHYFVDGGYFDNSGAGFVHEMIAELRRIIGDSLKKNQSHYLSHLRFYVIHAMNSPEGDPLLENVHPLQNDLMSPILTLLGSYTTQTSVNNQRLTKYLQEINTEISSKTNLRDTVYWKINLYANSRGVDYPMNWTISEFYRKKMDQQLITNRNLLRLIERLKRLRS